MTSDLEQRIAAALSGDSLLDSAALSTLYADTEAAISAADTEAERERARAYEPALTPDPSAARQALDDAVFRADRLRVLLPRVGTVLAAAQLAEARERFDRDYAAAAERRDAVAAKFARRYPAVVAELTNLFSEMKEIDKRCAEINAAAAALPNEHRRLRGVELVARGLEKFRRDTPSLLGEDGIRLPMLDDSKKIAWPPPQPSWSAAAAAMAAPAIGGQRYSADWWQAAEEDARQQKAADDRREADQQRADALALRAYEQSLLRR
jgi:hypothetical protein